jgi:ABC-type polysaccharide transport system permease subunit
VYDRHLLFHPLALISLIVSDFLAGVGAGVIEAIFAVTPMESIKTITIEKHLGLVSGVKHIWKEYGLAGFYKGAFATILKQSTNQVLPPLPFEGVMSLRD